MNVERDADADADSELEQDRKDDNLDEVDEVDAAAAEAEQALVNESEELERQEEAKEAQEALEAKEGKGKKAANGTPAAPCPPFPPCLVAAPSGSLVVLNMAQNESVQMAVSGQSFFVTGGAGTGKSVTVMHMVKQLREQELNHMTRLSPKSRVIVTATTHQAALTIEGVTIQSWSGLGLRSKWSYSELEQYVRSRGWIRTKWCDAKTILIDEVSMLSPDLFQALEKLARICRPDGKDLPFGGLQVIAIGDFAQLPPVSSSSSLARTKSPAFFGSGALPSPSTPTYAFEVPEWESVFSSTVVLSEIYRQADSRFSRVLNRIRLGEPLQPSEFQLLQSRLHFQFDDTNLKPTALYANNKDVAQHNLQQISLLDTPAVTFSAGLTSKTSREVEYLRARLQQQSQNFALTAQERTQGATRLQRLNQQTQKHAPSDRQVLEVRDKAFLKTQLQLQVTLKLGAQVMLVANLLPQHGLVNGSRGYVVGFVDAPPPRNFPIVQFATGVTQPVIIRPFGFRHALNNWWDAVFVQIPLRLAYAITVHKSQSLSMDCVSVALNDDMRQPGQAYTALSRVRSLGSLTLTSFRTSAFYVDPRVREFYARLNHMQQEQQLQQIMTDTAAVPRTLLAMPPMQQQDQPVSSLFSPTEPSTATIGRRTAPVSARQHHRAPLSSSFART